MKLERTLTVQQFATLRRHRVVRRDSRGVYTSGTGRTYLVLGGTVFCYQ